MFYKAKHRYSDVSPRKMRPFAQLIRGKNVDEALEQLRFLPNRGARMLEAVVKSAVGNAEDQGCRNLDDLVVSEARIDGGPMFKRIRPRARGTAFEIKRRLAHIVVTLTDHDAVDAAVGADVITETRPTTPPRSTTPKAGSGSAHPTVPTAGSPEQPPPTEG
jgi:large subunit ribosomal protein L22